MRKIFFTFVILLLVAVFASAQDNRNSAGIAACPNDADTTAAISNCKEQGMDYESYYDASQCKRVTCRVICPTDEELKESIAKCRSDDMDYETYEDKNGCKQVQCKKRQTGCPDADSLATDVAKCEDLSQSYEYYQSDDCRLVRCRDRIAMCKKSRDSDGCTIISCDDGYQFNSCKFCTNLQPLIVAAEEPPLQPPIEAADTGQPLIEAELPKQPAIEADTGEEEEPPNVFVRAGRWFKGIFS